MNFRLRPVSKRKEIEPKENVKLEKFSQIMKSKTNKRIGIPIRVTDLW